MTTKEAVNTGDLGNYQKGFERLTNYVKENALKEKDLKAKISESANNPEADVHNLGVIGHVDHGKSTVCARLCLENGYHSLRELNEVANLAMSLGMKSFSYAGLLGSTEELKRGMTITIAHRAFLTPKNRFFTMVDCPGHLDFVNNFTKGIGQTELALLVFDITEDFVTDHTLSTRQHAIIARASGVKSMILVLTKVGLVPVEKRAELIEKQAAIFKKFLGKFPIELEEDRFLHTACDALEGVNVSDKSFNDVELPGFKGPSLLQALDLIKLDKPDEKGQFIMPVDATYGGAESKISGVPGVATGRVLSGKLKQGDSVFIKPMKDATIREDVATGIETHHMKMSEVKAGFNVGLSMRKSRKQDMSPLGCMYTTSDENRKGNLPHLKLVKSITVRNARMIQHPSQLRVGSKMIIHTACGPTPAVLKNISNVYDLKYYTRSNPANKEFNLHIPEEYEKYMNDKSRWAVVKDENGNLAEPKPGFNPASVSVLEATQIRIDAIKLNQYAAVATLQFELQRSCVIRPVGYDSNNNQVYDRLSNVFGRDGAHTIFYGTVSDVKYDSSELF